MYSKFFHHPNLISLEQQLDMFLRELGEVTGEVVTIKMFQRDDEMVVLIIYNCWKKL